MFTTPRVILIGIIAAALALGWGIYTKRGVDLDKAKTTINDQKGQIGNLTETVQVNDLSDKITEKTQISVQKETAAAVIKLDAISDKTQKAVGAIYQKYREQDKTPEVQEQRAAEISATRISGAWRTWCEATQKWDDPGCAAYAPGVVSR